MAMISPDFVQRLLKKGYSKTSISEVLSESGFTRREIDAAFAFEQEAQQKKAVKKQKAHNPKPIIYASYIGELLVILLLVAAIPSVQPGTLALGMAVQDPVINCGKDIGRFKEIAENCNKASVLKDLDGTLLRFTSKNCAITKTIESFGPTETEDIIDMFEGKKMKCYFEQGNIPDKLLEGLAGGIENCNGPLKDALIELSERAS